MSEPAPTPARTGDDPDPTLLPFNQHRIIRERFSSAARAVVENLEQAGFEAYPVGGCVRDLLLGRNPKDFDIATNARPEQVKQLFPRSRIVGRRFRIVHVRMGREVIEVTTFRAQHASDNDSGSASETGLLLRDNVYGSLREDALRRDFTVNALYFRDSDAAIIDYSTGVEDLASHTLRIIGDPETRYREDPVRMLRALRFAAQLGFNLDAGSAQGIANCANSLLEVSSARLFDETVKLLMSGCSATIFKQLEYFGVLPILFPKTPAGHPISALALASTDRRIGEELPVTPAFLLAALLWPATLKRSAALAKAGESRANALAAAGREVLQEQADVMTLPRRHSLMVMDIWTLQPRLEKLQSRRAAKVLGHRRFRAAYDFLLLRESAGEDLGGAGDFWTRYQEKHPEKLFQPKREPQRRGRGRGRGRGSPGQARR